MYKLSHQVCSKLAYSVLEAYLIDEALSLKISITAFKAKDLLHVSFKLTWKFFYRLSFKEAENM